jgi:histidinol dehydrogenase
LVAADLAGVDQIYRVGGAQAIAALAYGTKSIPKVDKIVGPGNRYVATAKRLVFGVVDVDMVAGPSEILIISDGKSSPSSVAADLISQAEHDEMALPVLITTSGAFARKVERNRSSSCFEARRDCKGQPRRKRAILVVKRFATGHRVGQSDCARAFGSLPVPPRSIIEKIKNAGAVFRPPYPRSHWRLSGGPNHILPTAGTARFSSPLGVEDL